MLRARVPHPVVSEKSINSVCSVLRVSEDFCFLTVAQRIAV